MTDSKGIYSEFAREEAAARKARGRNGAPLAVHDAWQQAIRAGDPKRFPDVVDVQGYTENCLGLTGWTTGFYIALKNLYKNVLEPFQDLQFSVQEVVEGETAVALRMRAEGTHAKEYLGFPATGRRISWDAVAIVHTRGGKVVGMWSQADLYGILKQIQ